MMVRYHCEPCDGSGIVAGPGEYTTARCDICKGSGRREVPDRGPESAIGSPSEEDLEVAKFRDLARDLAKELYLRQDDNCRALVEHAQKILGAA